MDKRERFIYVVCYKIVTIDAVGCGHSWGGVDTNQQYQLSIDLGERNESHFNKR